MLPRKKQEKPEYENKTIEKAIQKIDDRLETVLNSINSLKGSIEYNLDNIEKCKKKIEAYQAEEKELTEIRKRILRESPTEAPQENIKNVSLKGKQAKAGKVQT
jgi:archaellum component FlaC